jgi:hypothetical protein
MYEECLYSDGEVGCDELMQISELWDDETFKWKFSPLSEILSGNWISWSESMRYLQIHHVNMNTDSSSSLSVQTLSPSQNR